MAADWQAIKTEYITTNTSYRKLADKYGICHGQIANVGGKENWVKLREQFVSKTIAKTENALSSEQAKRAAKIASVADKLIGKIAAYIDAVEPEMMDAKGIKYISGAIKDLRDIHFIRSDADIREQEARIQALRRQAETKNNEAEGVEVVMNIPEEYIG